MTIRKRKALIPFLFAAGAVLLISVTVIARTVTGGVKLDMTEENLYSLSDGTEKVMEKLQEPITARFFYNPELLNGIPVLHAYAERVKTLLNVYEKLSDGKFKLEVIDPEPFSREEDDAVAFGIEPVPMDRSGAQLYFGLALNNSVDEAKTFPFLSPEREPFLEYDITRAVYDLSMAEKPNVTLLSGIDLEGSPAGGFGFGGGGASEWSIAGYIKEEFDVTVAGKDDVNLPPDTDILVLIRPALLSEEQLKNIDAFLVNGGKILIFADPKTESAATAGEETNAMSALLDHWGLDYNPDLVALDAERAARASVVQSIDGDFRNIYLDRPDWILAGADVMSGAYPATANLQQLFFKSPGFVRYEPKQSAEGAPLTWQELVTTGEAAMEVNASDTENTEDLLRNYRPSGERKVLAGRLTGAFTSAYGNAPEGGKPKEGTVIFVADTDMLHDSAWLQKQNLFGQELHMQLSDNAAFALNIIDTLAGEGVLSGLRGRSAVDRPFHVVNEIRREAEREYLDKQQQLENTLSQTQKQLEELRQAAEGRDTLISAEERAATEQFRNKILETRAALREVRSSLRRDIEALGARLKFLLIGVLPGLIILAGIFLPGRIAGVKRA